MKQYEITFIVSENYNEDKAKAIAKEVRELIESRGGKIEKDVFWGKRKLAYKIAKNTFGYYFVNVFAMEPSIVNSLNRDLNLDEKVMRYLVGDYIENTSFFEEVGMKRKEGEKRPVYGDARDRAKQKPKKGEKRNEIKEEIVETPEIKEEIKEKLDKKESKKEIKEEIVEEVEAKEDPVVEEEIVETPEIKKEIPEEKPEEIKEEVTEEPEIEAKVEKKESISASIFAEASNDGKATNDKEIKENKEDEERPVKKKTLTDDERKAQLDAKLAELLKDEE